MLDKHPQSQAVIRFQDCDAFGHLNNARYIDYFLNARDDHLRAYYQFDLSEHARQHRENWVVVRHEIVYVRPAFPGETVTIQTGLLDLTDTTLTVEGIMLDEAAQQLKAVQWTSFRYVDLSRGRPARHPAEIADLLHEVVMAEDEQADTLDQRVRQLKALP